jgi:dolichol-phosphate mannosyltransferase
MTTGSSIPALSVVVPVYKEEHNIRAFLHRTEAALHEAGITYEIIFSLDPSPDRTEEIIRGEIKRNPAIRLLVLSRRFGQPAATMAGILSCRGAACCVIDVDLQDPPELIPKMHAKLSEGMDVVFAQRRTRAGETLLKKAIANFGYVVIKKLSDVEIPPNTGDFRIMSRRVVEELRALRETHGFLRGLVAFVGFPQAAITYDRDPGSLGRATIIAGPARSKSGSMAWSASPSGRFK